MTYKPWEHWDDDKDEFIGACNAQDNPRAYYCTQYPDHYGDHIAKTSTGQVAHQWPGTDEPLELVHSALVNLERDLR